MREGYYDKSFNLLLLGIDLLGISICFFISYYLRFQAGTTIPYEFYMFLLLCNILWVVVSFYNNIYLLSKLRDLGRSLKNLIYVIAIHILLVSLSFVSLKVQEAYTFPRLFLIYFYSVGFVLLFAIRNVYYFAIKYYYRNDQFNVIKVVIIGTGEIAEKLYDGFQKEISRGSSFKVMKFFGENGTGKFYSNIGTDALENLKKYCIDNRINEIYYTRPLTDKNLINDLTKFTDENFIYLRFVPEFQGLQKSKVSISFFNNIPIVEYTQAPLGGFLNQKIKRSFDILFALIVIVFVYPIVFPIVAILIKLESAGPVLFRQLRPGKGNELFECYKFRTMKVNNNTEKQATKNDPRITRIGSFLRKTSLDEFPQFLNVLQGKMSIVGPRPNLISQLEFYSKEIEKYRFRHFITPGITGWAQVNGFRGETEDIKLMKKRVDFDAWYIENWSLRLDIRIIFLTIFKLIIGDKRAY